MPGRDTDVVATRRMLEEVTGAAEGGEGTEETGITEASSATDKE